MLERDREGFQEVEHGLEKPVDEKGIFESVLVSHGLMATCMDMNQVADSQDNKQLTFFSIKALAASASLSSSFTSVDV